MKTPDDDPRIGRRGQPDHELLADRPPDPLQDLGREAHPVLERPAPFVRAQVGCLRPERVEEMAR